MKKTLRINHQAKEPSRGKYISDFFSCSCDLRLHSVLSSAITLCLPFNSAPPLSPLDHFDLCISYLRFSFSLFPPYFPGQRARSSLLGCSDFSKVDRTVYFPLMHLPVPSTPLISISCCDLSSHQNRRPKLAPCPSPSGIAPGDYQTSSSLFFADPSPGPTQPREPFCLTPTKLSH